MEVVLQKNYIDKELINAIPSITIRVENYEEGTVYYWNAETFHNRFDNQVCQKHRSYRHSGIKTDFR